MLAQQRKAGKVALGPCATLCWASVEATCFNLYRPSSSPSLRRTTPVIFVPCGPRIVTSRPGGSISDGRHLNFLQKALSSQKKVLGPVKMRPDLPAENMNSEACKAFGRPSAYSTPAHWLQHADAITQVLRTQYTVHP